jgi:hypothetical protein
MKSSFALLLISFCFSTSQLLAQTGITYSFGRAHLAPISKLGMQVGIGKQKKLYKPAQLQFDLCYYHNRSANDDVRASSFVYYQKGYASKFYKAFGLGITGQKVIYQNQNFCTGVGLSANYAKLGLKSLFNILEIDTLTQNSYAVQYTNTASPAASITTTAFAFLQCKLTSRLQLTSNIGVGAMLNKYSELGLTGKYDMVGFDTPPPMNFGVVYNWK